eukprot:scaffold292619_cov39-Tisochrysis_lutea.AAC.2
MASDSVRELCALALLCVASGLLLGRARRRALPLFLISLRRRPAKRASALERVAAAGFADVWLYDAVDGKDLRSRGLPTGVSVYDGWRLPTSTFRFYNRNLKWGEVGCALSHYHVWEKVVQLGLPFAVVVEDDAAFVENAREAVVHVVRRLEKLAMVGKVPPPDLLYLARKPCWPQHELSIENLVGDASMCSDTTRLVGCSIAEGVSDIRSGQSGSKCQSTDGFLCTDVGLGIVIPAFSYKTTAYVLWNSGAQKFLASNYLANLIPVDEFIPLLYSNHDPGPGLSRSDLDELFAHAPRLHAYAVKPMLARERRGLSDTENSEVMIRL